MNKGHEILVVESGMSQEKGRSALVEDLGREFWWTLVYPMTEARADPNCAVCAVLVDHAGHGERLRGPRGGGGGAARQHRRYGHAPSMQWQHY